MARIPVPSKLSGITNKIVSFSKRKSPSIRSITPLFTFYMPRGTHSSLRSSQKGPTNSEWCGFDVASTEVAIAKPIVAEKPLYASLISPSDGYSFLAFRLATFGRVNTCSVEVEMRSSTGEMLLHHRISTDKLSDNQFISCPPTYRHLKKGEEVIISLSSPDATEENCVAAWGIPSEVKTLSTSSLPQTQEIATGRVLLPAILSPSLIPHFSCVRGCAELALHTARGKTGSFNIPRQILPEQPYTIILSSGKGSYTDFSLLVATYGRTNTCSLRWEVFELSQQVRTPIAQGETTASLLKDNEWWSIPTGPIEGTTLALVISSRDATPSNCIALWVSSSTPTGDEKELCLPIELGSDTLSFGKYEAFVPFFSTKTENGIFYSGTCPNRGESSPRQQIITKGQGYTGYFSTSEPGLSIFTIECSSVDTTRTSHGRLLLLSEKLEILGDMTFEIPTKVTRKSYHLHLGASESNGSGRYTYVVSAIDEVPFALQGECFKDEGANNLTQEWRLGIPVIEVVPQTKTGLPEEVGAVPLHIPRYSLSVVSPDDPIHLIECGFRGENLAALPIPLGTVLWSFIAPAGKLSSIEFAIATFDRPNFCSVTVDIYRGRHIEAASLPKSCKVLSRIFDARTFTDNEGFSLSIDENVISNNEWFTVAVSSPDHTGRDKVALWCRTFSSHDGVHANLLQPRTEFLNSSDYTATRLNTRYFRRLRRESLHAQSSPTTALVIAENSALTSLAERILEALEEEGIIGKIITPGITSEEIWKMFPIDALFILGNTGGHFEELLSVCEQSLIPVLRLKDTEGSLFNKNSSFEFELCTTEGAKAQISILAPKGDGQVFTNSENHLSIRNLPGIMRERNSIGSTKSVGTTIEDVRNVNALQLLNLSSSLPCTSPNEIVVATTSSMMATRAVQILRQALPGTVVRTELNKVDVLSLEGTSAVLFYGVPPQREVENIIRNCHNVYVPVGLLEDEWSNFSHSLHDVEDSPSTQLSPIKRASTTSAKRYHQIIDFTLDLQSRSRVNIAEKIFDARTFFREKRLPRITIISVLYGKQREVPFFLQALERQSYKGPVELLLVDDCSPDGSVKAVEEYYEQAEKTRPEVNLPKLSILRNEKNTGNCGSRNRALSQATGEIIMIVDADCLLNRDCLFTHAQTHAIGDSDVVVGYFNLETGDGDPIEALLQFESTPYRVMKEAELQDSINVSSFLNTITRNFSIRHSFLEEKFGDTPLFDTLFSYSKDPQSGFGWEDVEMGYSLYERGARISFAPESFSVHVSHISNVDEKTKPLRSLKNFRRLLDKHPSIVKVARRWVTDTFNKIEAWIVSCNAPTTEDLIAVRNRLHRETPEVFCIPRKRPLRILSYRWHCPHQYEIYKLPHNFTLLTGFGPGFTSSWNVEERPLRPNVSMQQYRELSFKESDYDVAILHFDENSLSTYNCNNVLEPDWGAVFQWFATNLSIPKIAVCHGTPQFYGQYNPKYALANLGKVIEAERVKLVRYLSNIPVICNSFQAQSEWGFRNSRVVWQGFDPTEFQMTTYEKGILSLGRRIKERPVYRGLKTYEGALRRLPTEFEPASNVVAQPSPDHHHPSPTWARAKFRNYVNDIRQYSIYFNPTERSPMPRSRGEAMMCGLVPVSANNHDVEMFIQNGWNGFYSSSPEELGDFMLECLQNKTLLRAIGTRARETAIDLFNHDRFLASWQCTLNDLVGN